MTTKNKAAQALRAIKSETRAHASRENGKKGGRPVTRTLADCQSLPLSKLPGKVETGATAGIRYKVVPVADENCSDAIVIDWPGGKRTLIRSCDGGQWDQFMHRGC
jgi:hypothetical protein